MTTYQTLELEVIRWAEERGIIPNSAPATQLLKAVSELGDKDGVGDVLVCLIIYCALHDIHITDCIELAYDEIKHRKGKLLANGTFVKESN